MFYPFLDFLYPSPLYVLISFVIAALLDLAYPYHSGILLKIHPVHTSYLLSQRLYKPYSSKLRGIVIWIIVTMLHITLYTSLLYIFIRISPILWILLSSYIIKTSFSYKLLRDIVKSIADSIKEGNVEKAKVLVKNIVRRNVKYLDQRHVSSAAIESLSESFVDSVVSPIFYLFFFGPIGALTQRIANTLDGSLGFKDEEHKEAGAASAYIDTALNYIPARISILIIAASSLATGNSTKNLFVIWKKYRRKTESKNAGNPMASTAGSLMISLEKEGEYKLGEGPLPEHTDIYRALALIDVSYLVLTIIFVAALIIL
ncbi:MAG: cobalamin biosynthesis protein [Caldisphaeraceae archaeon]|nr:cobalamin biosynthesis protein [Caldisphaeraceae archaeon]